MNTEILPSDVNVAITLPVMEHFYTLQGEGRYQGQAAYFVRLGGCDVGCVWCDVKESWDKDKHPRLSIAEITEVIKGTPARIVVITGGEPLLHDLSELTAALKKQGLRTHMETSGSSPLSGTWDWITLSPKKFKAPLPEILTQANELKIVVYNKSDLLWAQQWASQVHKDCRLYLQPEWSRRDQMLPHIIDFIQYHPDWTLSMQIHKFINVP